MDKMLPTTKPQLKKDEAIRLLSSPELAWYKVKLLGIRGYYKSTLGDATKNDRNIYDDAMIIVSPDHYSTWNANTDPSKFQDNIAVLKAGGPYLYKIGMHGVSGPNPYEALRQASNVTVVRDGHGEFTDNPQSRFFIDIHRGGYHTTSSLGCQTIHPDQWPEFLKTVKAQMKTFNQDLIPYWLVEY
jgi:lysozyme